MKSRYNILFKNLKKKKEGCLIPFVVLGDPTLDISFKIINILIKNGADALELGLPFSDPIADGEIIQKAHIRSLKNNTTLEKCFLIIKKIRIKFPDIPIGILTYANIIYSQKVSFFYSQCKNIGIDSILIADLPIEESLEFQKLAQSNNISSIFICPPDAKKKLIYKISKYSEGYVYLVSRPGITGLKKKYSNSLLIKVIKKLKEYKSAPIIQGFGISTKDQIKNSLNIGVNGIICGSVIVQIIENYFLNELILIKKMKKIIKNLKKYTKN